MDLSRTEYPLKYLKMKNSLEDIREREKRARLRNQTFLQELDYIEARLLGLISSANGLQQKRMQQISAQAEIDTNLNMSRKTHHPATIFMGRHTSENSSIEHCLTQRKSPQPTKSFSISDPHSVRQPAINGNLTDSCVVPANSDIQCLNKPDKMDEETCFQISQKMPVTSNASSEDGRTHHVEIDKTQSGRKHLVESRQSAQLSTQTLERLSPENRAEDLQNDSPGNKVEKSLMYERLVPNEERFTHTNLSGSSPDACDYINKQTSDKHSGSENLSDKKEFCHIIPEPNDIEFLDSSSDLTVSITESEDDDSYPHDEMIGNQNKDQSIPLTKPTKLNNNNSPKDTKVNSYYESTVNRNNLSDQGFAHLLKSIENMVLLKRAECIDLYQKTDICQTKLDHLIGICNQIGPLKIEDFENCSALVVHQLQKVMKNTASGYKQQNNSYSEVTERSLQECLHNHLSFLKKHCILNNESIPEVFASLMTTRYMTKDINASVEGEKKMTTVPCTSTENSVKKPSDPYKHIPYVQSNLSNPDVTSSSEDDKKLENTKERLHITALSGAPIQSTETIVQYGTHAEKESDEEEISDTSELDIPGLAADDGNSQTRKIDKRSTENSFSSSEKSSPSREEAKSRVPMYKLPNSASTNKEPSKPNIKSKAFWGESEDSSSEIEAMLKPQSENTDDFDDFFD